MAQADRTAKGFFLFLLNLGFSDSRAENTPFLDVLIFAELEKERKEAENKAADEAREEGGVAEFKILNRD